MQVKELIRQLKCFNKEMHVVVSTAYDKKPRQQEIVIVRYSQMTCQIEVAK